jgi:group II intron reverse transcriptase/maturase
MTQQKSENSIVPEDRGNTIQSPVEKPSGGKAVPVNEQMYQPRLPGMTAENLEKMRTDGEKNRDLSRKEMKLAPKIPDKEGKSTSATLERVIELLWKAFAKVARNKGAPGPDGVTIEMARENLGTILENVKNELRLERYTPGEVRRVFIPKPGGKQRGLGIPNVIDRVVQEAVRQVVEPIFEPRFHGSSHGFRPGRSCHTAIQEAVKHVEAGHGWVVDFDLEKYFDRVHHQRLMARLASRIGDKRLLVLLGKMLKAKVIMPEGVVVKTEEGVPQGGPLSPLLSNIVLDELDWELERRGHRFVRYADDCNVFVKSQRAGERVMEGIIKYLGKKLRLKVNRDKSAVARPEERHFVGFRLKVTPEGKVEVLLSERTKRRIDARIVELTPRNWGNSLRYCIERLNKYLKGWIGFFGKCTGQVESVLGSLDAHIRRRLRAILFKHWKRKRTMIRKLTFYGARHKTALKSVCQGRKSIWALSISSASHAALRNKRFEEWGLVSLKGRKFLENTMQVRIFTLKYNLLDQCFSDDKVREFLCDKHVS